MSEFGLECKKSHSSRGVLGSSPHLSLMGGIMMVGWGQRIKNKTGPKIC